MAELDQEQEEFPIRRTRNRRVSRQLAKLGNSDFVVNTTTTLFSAYLRFVKATGNLIYEPCTPEVFMSRAAPVIFTCWHGQHFLLPLIRPKSWPVDVLVSRHRDGEVMTRILKRLGAGAVRGSGTADPARMFEKGGVSGFRSLKAALEQGRSVMMTADHLPSAGRKASLGIVVLARATGRPIIPIALATSRRHEIKSSWDRTTINLPFSRAGCVLGEPILVPEMADDALLELKRREIEKNLDVATDRAYAIADRRRG